MAASDTGWWGHLRHGHERGRMRENNNSNTVNNMFSVTRRSNIRLLLVATSTNLIVNNNCSERD
ncbi:hypothetical protein OUZ56_003064 [Daphnia magna]|uniref:Uncharacterized protein n=1 Tax=Daphnia magna TaxID=35525 RepID=A0ABR0A7M1_9CRUS|nr:hypothetical protein OUZ56_003064 [Daphnia magna]